MRHHKSRVIAYLLFFIGGFGVLGLHRFYLHKWSTGVLYMLTFGFLFIGCLFDLFTLWDSVDEYNYYGNHLARRRAYRRIDRRVAERLI